MTASEMAKAKRIIRKAYRFGADKKLSSAEVEVELENLRRKEQKGNLDDHQLRLLCELEVACHL